MLMADEKGAHVFFLPTGDGVRTFSARRERSEHLQAGEPAPNQPDQDRQDI